MNQRIKELAQQANFTEQDIQDMSPGFEKFAELIIADVLKEVLEAMDEGMDVYYTVKDKFK